MAKNGSNGKVKGEAGSGNTGNKISTKQNAKLADIYTSAKSTMEPEDYSQGWPDNSGQLHNTNFTGKRKGA